MSKKIIIVVICIFIATIIGIWFFVSKRDEKTTQTPLNKEITAAIKSPSESLKEYTDDSGFTFSYPDNLSIAKNDATDNSTYADIKLSSKDVSGSLSFTVFDSKIKSNKDWLLQNASESGSQDAKLGELDALEINQNDGLVTVAINEGVLFKTHVQFADNKEYWKKVYSTFLTHFAFSSPAPETNSPQSVQSGSADGDVVFEGEDVAQ